MKKILDITMMTTLTTIVAFMMLMVMAGCTSVKATTTKTNPDGTSTKSYVHLYGFGDKNSSIAGEGVFADGADDDLGAGVKSATGTQESSGVADMFRIMLEMMRMQAVPIATAPVPTVQRSMSTAGAMSTDGTQTCPTCGTCNECAPPR